MPQAGISKFMASKLGPGLRHTRSDAIPIGCRRRSPSTGRVVTQFDGKPPYREP